MVSRFIYWTPRIFSIVLVAFLIIFSFDVFEGNLGFWQILLAFLMHNIPVIILAIVIWISWRYEIVGGIAFILAGIAHLAFSLLREDAEPMYVSFAFSLVLDVPAFLVGVLFLVGWFKKAR